MTYRIPLPKTEIAALGLCLDTWDHTYLCKSMERGLLVEYERPEPGEDDFRDRILVNGKLLCEVPDPFAPKSKVVNVRYADSGTYIYVGRPTKWGNVYSHLPESQALYVVGSRDEACDGYERWFYTQEHLVRSLHEIRGHDLGCWCAPARCHADFLVRVANG